MPTDPQLSCSLAQKSVQNQTLLLWHLNNMQFTCGVPSGDMLRISRRSQGIGVSNPKFFHSMQLQDMCQSLQSALLTVHRQYTMHGLPHHRLPLAQQQAVAHQLQLEFCQRITLHLLTSMLPFFPTCVAHMNAELKCCKVTFIKVS